MAIKHFKPIVVEYGSHNVVILEKLYGPAVIAPIRVYLDDDYNIVVEQDVGSDEDSNFQPVWKQVARFDGDPGAEEEV